MALSAPHLVPVWCAVSPCGSLLLCCLLSGLLFSVCCVSFSPLLLLLRKRHRVTRSPGASPRGSAYSLDGGRPWRSAPAAQASRAISEEAPLQLPILGMREKRILGALPPRPPALRGGRVSVSLCGPKTAVFCFGFTLGNQAYMPSLGSEDVSVCVLAHHP